MNSVSNTTARAIGDAKEMKNAKCKMVALWVQKEKAYQGRYPQHRLVVLFEIGKGRFHCVL